MKLLSIFSLLYLVCADVDVAFITPAENLPSRDLGDRRKPDFGGKQGSANGSDLSKHKNKIKSIGVKFFAEDALTVFEQQGSWNETYGYDSSVGYHWFGGTREGLATMNILIRDYYDQNSQNTVITGSASTEGYIYNFQSIDGDLLEVTAINGSDFPSESEPKENQHHRSLPGNIDGNRNLIAEDGSRIDVICFYTRQALCYEAGQSYNCNLDQYKYLMDNKCALAISETNVAYQNSGVLTRLRLVYSGYLDVSQSSSFCSNLDLMRTGTASTWVNARNLRSLYKADLMHMIIDDPSSCGCAYYDSWVSVSHRTCTTGYFSFGHEMGHNLGCRHDPMTNSGVPCSQLSGSNYGYQDPAYRFRSIMAYNCIEYCPRLQYFSTPDKLLSNYQDAPIGSYCENNVAKINSARVTAANYMVYESPSPTNVPTTRSPSISRRPRMPTRSPTKRPTRRPSRKPTFKPKPSKPTKKPISKPTRKPSRKPSSRPTKFVSKKPSYKPTRKPSSGPTKKPSYKPTRNPSDSPTMTPTVV